MSTDFKREKQVYERVLRHAEKAMNVLGEIDTFELTSDEYDLYVSASAYLTNFIAQVETNKPK